MGMKIVLFAGNERFKQKLEEFCNENMLVWHDFEQKNEFVPALYISKLDFPYQISFLENKIICIGSDSLFKHPTTKEELIFMLEPKHIGSWKILDAEIE